MGEPGMDGSDRQHVFRDALFLDIPYIIDSFCRHADYTLNRLHRPQINSAPETPSCTAVRGFTLLVVLLLCTAYGPTLDSLCGVFGARTLDSSRSAGGVICIVLAVAQFVISAWYFWGRVQRRFRKQRIPGIARKLITCGVLLIVLAIWALPLLFFGDALLEHDIHDGCRPQGQAWPAWVQLGSLVVVTLVSAWLLRRARPVRSRILWQAVLIAVLVLVLWHLPHVHPRTEAAQVPYPHLFAVAAIGFALIACLAPWLVEIPFGSITDTERGEAQAALTTTELFIDNRRDPPLSPRRIFGGCVIG